METKSYACYNVDEYERSISSSGGIYPLIAKEVLRLNGVVYAALYNDNLEVKHMRIDNIKDLQLSQGSKYVQSSLSTTFRSIIDELQVGHRILFVGTPCQCAGLSSLIKISKVDPSNILLMDFVCHGVPGNAAWRSYLKSCEAQGKVIKSVNMRDKSTGWTNGDYSWREITTSGKEIITPRRKNPYMIGMLANLYLRPACYECRFKGITRCTDITLGDYWGVWTHLPEMDDNRGTSLVLIHTKHGLDLFMQIKDRIKYTEADIEKAIVGNSCLIESANDNPKRKEFYERLQTGEDFSSIVNDLASKSSIRKILNRLRLLHRNRE